MKSQQKINLLFFIVIIGLIIALIVVSIEETKQLETPNTQHFSQHQLLEVKTKPQKWEAPAFGLVSSDVQTDVKLNVSGKIDDDNHLLRTGTTFKKNEVLIKVDRLEVLYELLINRLNYKKSIQESLPKIAAQFPKEESKWRAFEEGVERTLPLPVLPKARSKEEENLLNDLNVYSFYYKVKKIEQKAENYIYVAPFDGFISESSIGPGSMIEKNTLLMKLSKENTLVVTAHIPIHSVKNYERAEKVYFIGSETDTIGHGSYKRTGSVLSDSSMVEVIFTITPQKQSIQNLSVEIRVPENPQSKGVKLPISAIHNKNVFLFSNNTIIETPVQIISKERDSVRVEGLPEHCFLISKAKHVQKKQDK